jgi:hypothetical protein
MFERPLAFRIALRFAACCTVPLLLGALTTACSKRHADASPKPVSSAASPVARGMASAGAVREVAALTSSVAPSPAGALELQPARILPGTGLAVALPKGAVRPGRPLTFSLPDRALAFTLSHSESTLSAKAAVDSAAHVFGLMEEFSKRGDAWVLSQSPLRAAVTGEANKDMFGTPATGLAGLIAAHSDGGRLFFLRASFKEQDRSAVESVARSIQLHPTEALDPLGVHGLSMKLLDGYTLKPGQLEPYVMPSGETPREGLASLDLRIAGPGKVTDLFEELLKIFEADAPKTQCEPAEEVPATGSALKYRHQTCVFDTSRGPYRVRTDLLEDAQGGVVSVMTRPKAGAEQQIAAMEEMVATLRLKALPAY